MKILTKLLTTEPRRGLFVQSFFNASSNFAAAENGKVGSNFMAEKNGQVSTKFAAGTKISASLKFAAGTKIPASSKNFASNQQKFFC